MTRIGLTQRVVKVTEYGERRDCLDQAWIPLLEEVGYQPVILPNQITDVEAYLSALSLDGLILTSGNDLTSLDDPTEPAPERDRFETAAVEYAMDTTTPVLGVCRGLELLNHYFGGELVTVEGHVATHHQLEFTADVEFEIGSATPTVNSYHEYGIESNGLAAPLEPLAYAPDQTIECVVHESLPFWGIMWHPERDPPMSELDRTLLTHIFGAENR